MKILIDSYNCVCQNPAGGVRTRLSFLSQEFDRKNIDYKFYNKWEDSINSCDIFHYFKAHRESYDILFRAKKKQKKIILSSILPIDFSFKSKFNRKMSFLHNSEYFIRKSLELSDRIICQTIYEKKFIEKFYCIDPNKLKIIPNGIDENILKVSSNKFLSDFPINKDFILQVGCIEKNKNQLSVIRAVRKLNLPLVLIGGPNPLELDYWNQCKKEAGDNVLFLGWITDKRILYSALRACKVFILPSFFEIFGNSMFEGALAGANIVSTNVLPLEDWGVSEMLISVNPKSEKEIGNALFDAFKKEKNSNLSNYVLKNFSWDSVSNQYINLYKNLLYD